VNNGLKREAVLVREESRYIESVARQELGMVKQGDLVYRFMEPAGKKDEPSPDGDKPSSKAGNGSAVLPGSPI